MGYRELFTILPLRHLLLLLLPQSGAQLPVLLELSANRHLLSYLMFLIGRNASTDRGWPMVKDFAPHLIGGRPAELLRAHLGRIVAMVFGSKSGDMGGHLRCPVSGGTSEALQGDQAGSRGSGLANLLVGAAIFAHLLFITSPEHGAQHLGVVAVGLHFRL